MLEQLLRSKDNPELFITEIKEGCSRFGSDNCSAVLACII